MRRLGLIALLFFNTQFVNAACQITGCNGELCVRNGEGGISTCLWKAEYACYKQYGICEADDNGQCAWRQTPELVACVKTMQDNVEKADPFSD